MSGLVQISLNDKPVRIGLKKFVDRVRSQDMLNIIGNYMVGSVMRTFKDQGSPAGSWKPLAAWTATGAANRIGFRKGKVAIGRRSAHHPLRAGKQILIDSSHLMHSVNYQVQSDSVMIGSALKYARIQQLGGTAGRKPPFKKKDGKRPFIPARPYLVLRPEDPGNIVATLQTYLETAAKRSGLETQ